MKKSLLLTALICALLPAMAHATAISCDTGCTTNTVSDDLNCLKAAELTCSIQTCDPNTGTCVWECKAAEFHSPTYPGHDLFYRCQDGHATSYELPEAP